MKPKDRPSYRWLLWSLALLGAALDQASKCGVFHWLAQDGVGGNQELVSGTFELLAQYDAPDPQRDPRLAAEEGPLLAALRPRAGNALPRVNQGALFGFLGDHKELANNVFAVVSVIAAAAIAYWSLRRSTARDKWLCAALGLILAGTLGNLYDRIVFHGVRDFLHWYRAFEWPVFNLADCCLVFGAGLLLLQALWSRSAAAPMRLMPPKDAAFSTEMVEAN